jgi:aromatic-amino-acid transaminase
MLHADEPTTIFSALASHPADSLLKLIALHREDKRPDKIDLGVGVYRTEEGKTPVMRAVKLAEQRLLNEQQTKAYLGPEGDRVFVESLANIVLGCDIAASDRLTGVQTPGGTGALRLAAELLSRAQPRAKVWMGRPSWPNHAPIFADAGLSIIEHPFFDPAIGDVDFEGMLAALSNAERGDIVLIHGCCHNPTGVNFDLKQRSRLVDMMEQRDLVPVIDLAYHGLGDALDRDAAGTRYALARLPSALVAYSCNKNFALYRERVGALWVQGASPRETSVVRQNLLVLARHLWSMPPDHGAALVRLILSEAELKLMWQDELSDMQQRLAGLRFELAQAHPSFASIGYQKGMFALLPLRREDVNLLRLQHGIYMADNGRINIAGLTERTIPRFVELVAPLLIAE